MLNSKEIEYRGEVFEIRELTMRQMAPLLPRLTGDEAMQAQMEMLTLAVYKDGKPMGDAVLDLGASAFTELSAAMMDVGGFGASEGND